ncbi:hypothetical protein DINM_005069 [Dirofilaria immitis]|nr:hypothetical protein [Dirofilaria immitis]
MHGRANIASMPLSVRIFIYRDGFYSPEAPRILAPCRSCMLLIYTARIIWHTSYAEQVLPFAILCIIIFQKIIRWTTREEEKENGKAEERRSSSISRCAKYTSNKCSGLEFMLLNCFGLGHERAFSNRLVNYHLYPSC